jgi:SAM-dependent methyltransferase
MTDLADARLAEQYEAYPYPARNPREEAGRLLIGSPSHLREIDHWVFAGRRGRPTPLRALVAGGGTGDAVVMLATQLAREGRPGEVVYLDRSAAAMRIARARVEARGLGNVQWHHGSIHDLPGMALGLFDYVDCCGVLHHLPDPAAALSGLVSVLAPGGGMGLMVYAPYGRTGIYEIQAALDLIAPADEKLAERLDAGRRVLRELPDGAWLTLNTGVTDHLKGGDAGLVDVLLNPRDRPYALGDFLDLVEGAGLRTTCLLEPARYDPNLYVADPVLRRRFSALPPRKRAMLAELLSGRMSTHVAYCVRAELPEIVPDWTAADAVPVIREGTGAALAASIAPDNTLPFECEALRARVALPRLAGAALRLIDGRRNVASIAAELASRGVARDRFDREWPELARRLESINRLLLAAPS